MASLGIFPVRDFDGFEIDGPTGQASDGRARDHGTERAPAAGVGNERTDGSGPAADRPLAAAEPEITIQAPSVPLGGFGGVG